MVDPSVFLTDTVITRAFADSGAVFAAIGARIPTFEQHTEEHSEQQATMMNHVVIEARQALETQRPRFSSGADEVLRRSLQQ